MTHYADPRLRDLDLMLPPKGGPAVLLYDIETAPALVWVWSQWQTNVIDTQQDWYMLSFAYKWLGGPSRVGFVSVQQDPERVPNEPNDWWVANRLHTLFDRADVTVAHNGDRFDRPKANTRFLYWNMPPPSPYQSIDTKKWATREFKHYSNALKELGRFHHLGSKTPHSGFELWRQCMAGDAKAWRLMEKYNKQDVRLLESVYRKMLPWQGGPGRAALPNAQQWSIAECCPKPGCGNAEDPWYVRRGYHRTAHNRWATLQCRSCGGYSRSKVAENQKELGLTAV